MDDFLSKSMVFTPKLWISQVFGVTHGKDGVPKIWLPVHRPTEKVGCVCEYLIPSSTGIRSRRRRRWMDVYTAIVTIMHCIFPFPIVSTGPFVAHSLIFLSGTHHVSGRGRRAGPSSS
ncbi:hypothetical protein LguiB_020922 [Lonicera macranthoides]